MAEVEENQTETVNAEKAEKKQEKKAKKSRKSAKAKDADAKDDDAKEEDAEEKPKKPKRYTMDNPSIHDQIIEALDVLDERKGVTLVAIKRYLEDNYHVNMAKTAFLVRKVLINGVEKGDIIRTRGTGALGRFKVKHTKPTMIKKRAAPEDYQQLPYITRVPKAKPKKETTPSKAKATPKKESPKAKTPKGKKGRPGKKRK